MIRFLSLFFVFIVFCGCDNRQSVKDAGVNRFEPVPGVGVVVEVSAIRKCEGDYMFLYFDYTVEVEDGVEVYMDWWKISVEVNGVVSDQIYDDAMVSYGVTSRRMERSSTTKFYAVFPIECLTWNEFDVNVLDFGLRGKPDIFGENITTPSDSGNSMRRSGTENDTLGTGLD